MGMANFPHINFEEHDYTGDNGGDGKGKVHSFTLADLTEKSTTTHDLVPKEHRVVGGYDMTGNGGGPWSVMFMMKDKPNWFHRLCTRFFLGWVWVDKND
jgi:hypothetical protein